MLLSVNQQAGKKLHPAAEWAMSHSFDEIEVDCTITVVLKILDGKCKMSAGEKAAIMEIYDVVRHFPGKLFNDDTHMCIDHARSSLDELNRVEIHRLRVYAESEIPKPIMKKYKAMLRHGLFG